MRRFMKQVWNCTLVIVLLIFAIPLILLHLVFCIAAYSASVIYVILFALFVGSDVDKEE